MLELLELLAEYHVRRSEDSCIFILIWKHYESLLAIFSYTGAAVIRTDSRERPWYRQTYIPIKVTNTSKYSPNWTLFFSWKSESDRPWEQLMVLVLVMALMIFLRWPRASILIFISFSSLRSNSWLGVVNPL